MQLPIQRVVLVSLLVMVILEQSDALKVRKARRLKKTIRQTKLVPIKFECTGRAVGYYADVDFDCRVFHICDNFGRRIPMYCPPQTQFNQMYRVCDWPNNVDCADSTAWYFLNDRTYESPPPAVSSDTASSNDKRQ